MSNLYEITKSIHNEIERINQKLGLKIKIKSKSYILENGKVLVRGYNLDDSFVRAIQSPQIRQILVGLKKVLDNCDRSWVADNFGWFVFELFQGFASSLCSQWIDGLSPLFDREPELVLTELLEILKAL